ncbi:MAG TPA: bacterial transcriptional activator domain-containing protein, partial [Microthrixaceae bacterium]|nr:bacterial transcriptional activator domain-containing protein [Microthrixaceae bacterium]
WKIAEDRLEVDLGREADNPEVAPYWQEVIGANEDLFVQPGNPSLIYPGQVFVLPPTGPEQPQLDSVDPSSPNDAAETEEVSPAPVAPEANDTVEDETLPAATTPPAPVESETSTRTIEVPDRIGVADDHTADDDESTNNGLPVGVAIGGLSSVALAVGLKRLLDRRRRLFANEHPGQLPGRTPPEQREMHQAIIGQADEERIDDLQDVLGRLAVSLAEAGSDRRPRIVRHSEDCLEVLLDQPDTNAPVGWSSTEDGAVWTLVELPGLVDPNEGPLNPAPLLVTVGQPEDDAQLYLDLEADGLLALTGDPDVATNLARSIFTELTLSPLTETLRVIAVGDVLDPDAKVLDHLSIVDSWEDLAEDLTAWATQSHEVLVDRGWANTFVGRGHEPDHDALVPVAVVADRPPPDHLADALRDTRPSAVAVVVVGEFDGALTSVRCEDDSLNFDTIDLACSLQKLEADELADISQVLASADIPAEQDLMDQMAAEHVADGSSNGSEPATANGEHADSEEGELGAEPGEPPGYDVLVRLLGDITVEGGKPLKPKATAVVAYLALHRSVTTERLDEACWFGSDGISHVKRLRDTMTESRDALGSQHFPANRSGSYLAGPRVRTDLDLFDWHVQRAANLESEEAVEHYRAALDLVTGRPFSYPNSARVSYGWVDFEHHSTTWELRITGVAQACAAMCIDFNEPGEAIGLLHRIVQTIPLNSALVEALMRAHIANDDPTGAESVYKAHAVALDRANFGDPDDSIEGLRPGHFRQN